MELKETFIKAGKDLMEFYDACSEMDKCTTFIPVNTGDVKLLTYIPEKEDAESIFFWMHTPKHPYGKTEVVKLKKEKLAKVDPELLDELRRNKLMVYINNTTAFTAGGFISTVASRCGLGGDRIAMPSPGRDSYLAEIFGDLSDSVTVVQRHDGNAKKVFAMHSGRYAHIRQTVLTDVIANISPSLGKAEVRGWTVDHDLTKIVITFPEKAEDVAATYGLPDKMTPVLYLGTSDTGESSVTAIGGWMNPSGIISYENIYKRVHKGTVTAGDILDRVEKKIFSQYTVLPERLCELMAIPIEDVPYAYDQVITQTGLRKKLGQKNSKKLLAELEAELMPGYKYTAYNIAVTFLDLPRRLTGYCKEMEMDLQAACGHAPYCNYKVLAAKKKAVPGALVLTA